MVAQVIGLIISIVAVVVAVIAILITIRTNRMQIQVALFNERYILITRLEKLLSLARFIDIIQGAENKENVWNIAFGGLFSKSYSLGMDIIKINKEIEEWENDSEEKEKLVEKKRSKILTKALLDNVVIEEERANIYKVDWLFPKEICKYVHSFFCAFSAFQLHVNLSNEEELEELAANLDKAVCEMWDNRIIEQMEKYIEIDKESRIAVWKKGIIAHFRNLKNKSSKWKWKDNA